MKWKIQWAEHEFTEDDLTVGHICLVAAAMNEDSFTLTPTRGPVSLLAYIATWVAIAEQRPYQLVAAELTAVPLNEFSEALTVE